MSTTSGAPYATEYAMPQRVRLELGLLRRWHIVKEDQRHLAWSGSRWVDHYNGLATGEAQVCNFGSMREALVYCETHNLQVVN